MSKYADHTEAPIILKTITSLLAALTEPPPLSVARGLILHSGFQFVSSIESGNLQQTLSEWIDSVEGLKGEGKNESGVYQLVETEPAPEIFIYEKKIATVWALLRIVAPDGGVQYLSYAVFTLIKFDDGWKISGYVHTIPSRGSPLPSVSRERTPDTDRMIHFADEMYRLKGIPNLEDWLLPKARFVRHKLPDPPKAAAIEDTVQYFTGWVNTLPAGTDWREDFEDVTVRTAGDLGLIWMHFDVFLDGKLTGKGIDILTLHWQDDKWLFSGTQTLNVGV